MGPGIACPFEISGRAADVTNLRSPLVGQKQSCVQFVMSALPPKADIRQCERNVSFVPIAS
jgi:hypothetical protein